MFAKEKVFVQSLRALVKRFAKLLEDSLPPNAIVCYYRVSEYTKAFEYNVIMLR